MTYTDPQTNLAVRLVVLQYRDFPAIEWVIYFKNQGPRETPILSEIQALDTLLICNSGNPAVYYAQGSRATPKDFMPLRWELNLKGEPYFPGSAEKLYLEPGGGRSSSEFLPFFNIEAKEEGAIMAIGWTGEWAAQFDPPRRSPLHSG